MAVKIRIRSVFDDALFSAHFLQGSCYEMIPSCAVIGKSFVVWVHRMLHQICNNILTHSTFGHLVIGVVHKLFYFRESY